MGCHVCGEFFGEERREADRPAGSGCLERFLNAELAPQQVESIGT
jgi:hypothetical protein